MGLIRRSALQDVGGWDEWCITEDAELSLRLLKAGWDGQHVERSFGHGVMPLSFEALKRQRFRWCFGGVQILRKHWRSLLPWDRSESNHLTFKQRYDYLAGGLQWFGSLLALGFAGLLLAGTLDLVVGSGYTFRRLSGAILVVPPLLLGVELARSVGLIRRRTGASLRDAFGALRIWLALGLTVAKACALGLVRPEGVFLRTPKTKGEGSWRDAVTANRVEVGLGLLLICCAPLAMLRIPSATAAVLGTLLAWHAAAFLFAPAQTVAALHADLPPELRRLRRNDWVRERLAATRKPIRIGAGAGALVGLGVALVLLLAPHPHAHVGPGPDVIGEARGRTSSSRTSPGTASTSATGGGLSRTGSGGTPSTPSGAANLSSSTSTVAGSQGVAAATHGAAVSTTLPGATPPSTRGAVSTTVAPGPPSTTPATVPTSSLPLPPTSRGRTSSPPTTRAHP